MEICALSDASRDRLLGEEKYFIAREMMTINEVTVNDLTPVDTVLMETAHSTYQFSVTNPTTRTGILSGGLLSQNPIEANFLCSVSAKEDCKDDTSKIKVGSRAIFIYASEAGTRYIVISAIT